MWLDDEDGDDTPIGGGIPDPSQRHWRHPSEVAAELAATHAPELTPDSSVSRWPIMWPFGALVGSIGICSFAVLAVVLSGFGDKPLNADTYQVASGQDPNNPNGGTIGSEPASPTLTGGTSTQVSAPGRAAEEVIASAETAGTLSTLEDESLERVTSSGGPSDVPSSEATSVEATDSQTTSSEPSVETSEGDQDTSATMVDYDGEIETESTGEIDETDPEDDTQVAPSDPSPVPTLFAEADARSTPLGSFVASDGFVLTSRAALGQAAEAAIESGGSWVVLRAVLEADGVTVLIPAEGHSLAELAPLTVKQPGTLAVGDTVLAGSADPAVTRHVGIVTGIGDRITTDIAFDPSLAGAPLFDSAGSAIGVVTPGIATPNGSPNGVVVAKAMSETIANQLSEPGPTFNVVGIDGLSIEPTPSGLVVRKASGADVDSVLGLSNFVKVGDKIVQCNDVPVRTIADIASVAAIFTSGTASKCTIERGDISVVVTQKDINRLTIPAPQD